MKRRSVLAGLLGSLAIKPALPREVDAPPEPDADWLLRDVAGVEPLPGEARRVRSALQATQMTERSDPRIQPSFTFHPDAES